MAPVELILASGSSARRKLLEAAGVAFRVAPADVEEDDLRAALGPTAAPARVALTLARAKAEEASRRAPGALVVGADQVLALGGTIYTKPPDVGAARRQLRSLSGQTHELLSAVSLAQDGQEIWSHIETASLTMREFSDAFLDNYMASVGDRVCASVGAYELEGLGIQLFAQIEGDYFTILGLPLLPLLAELRCRRVIKT